MCVCAFVCVCVCVRACVCVYIYIYIYIVYFIYIYKVHNSCTLKLYFHLRCNSFDMYEMTLPICTSHWCLVMNF